MIRKHVMVHGVVQGVFYRKATQREARRLGLNGWVRNRADGTRVELVAEGEEAVVDELVAWCRQGPPAARVERLEVVDDASADPLGDDFELRPTA